MVYKPERYTSVSPYLLVRDAERTLKFMEATFGAERLRAMPGPDGAGGHFEARIDDTVVMMGETPEGPDTNVHVYVSDADTTFARAKEAGGTVVQELTERGDGDRRGGIADGNGTVWWIATQVGE